MATLPETFPDDLQIRFDAQHRASRELVQVPLAVRRHRLSLLATLVKDHADEFARAISADFGHRSAHETRLLEIFPALEAIRHARKALPGWMKPLRRGPSRWFFTGQARVVAQPLGVVGIVVPWNYPLLLAVSPLAAALAAGNRALVKMSEYTPRTGELLAALAVRYFQPEEVAVVNGDASVGARFVSLPLDHLLFTGSTSVGRAVMRAAAENLTPVTLELGGKSPAIVAPGYPMRHAAERIMAGKLVNAGQTCIAPDYVLVPRGQEQGFADEARRVVARFYPDMAGTRDYSAIITERHFARLQGLLADARERGAEQIDLTATPADPASRRMPPVLLRGVDDDMQVMQDEIFGPILPVLPFDDMAQAIAHVNARPRPLALYLFDQDRARVDHVLASTVVGGVSVNDTLLHIAQEELPFGGVGPSGMGHYHGEEGFRTFSKLTGVFHQSRLNSVSLLNPPYGRVADSLLRLLTR